MKIQRSVSRVCCDACQPSRKSTHVGIRWPLRFAVLQAMLACALLTSPSMGAAADAVLQWNQIMERTVGVSNPNFQGRSAAIVQLAVYEAVNAIVGEYEPYLGSISAPPGASPGAACIAAAHRTLVALYPASASDLDALWAGALAEIPDGQPKAAGVAVGEAAAIAMLQLRANDGAALAGTVPYTPGTDPGKWQPTPPAFAPAAQPGWGFVMPFALETGSQFRLPPPPPIGSGRYARDYNEVKLVGQNSSQFRPQDRTAVARFYAITSAVQAWNPAARQVSAAKGKTLSENARIFALLAVALCDASIATYDSKYYYNFWRPVTAIAGGGIDDNRLTEADSGWLPLITTPPFPSYPSAHASFAGAAQTVLDRLLGNHGHAITLQNPLLPGLALNYSNFRQISDDIDDARIYGGIHFRFDQEAGGRQGKEVANHILDNYLLRLDNVE